ncbi:hypothetical protein AYL99_02737 [Fonsecaea erecta]|uniref:Uncharacterized protein n=1 Tax=Fonsecaea erecta TaxID=1367422 RepID=A0A178ZUR4_9EURO|nr:hypothetical protein AYL99_02737 [Fonsecaea erecta]OAP63510.1 hypothetical protein AYL99_02737 [Fonsecaea erecta]
MTDHQASMGDCDKEDPMQSLAAKDGSDSEEWSRACSRQASVEPSDADAGNTEQPVRHNRNNNSNDSSGSDGSERSGVDTQPNLADVYERDCRLTLCFPARMATPPFHRQGSGGGSQASLSFGTQAGDGPGFDEPQQPNGPEEQTEPRDTSNNRRQEEPQAKAPAKRKGGSSQSSKRSTRRRT